MKFFESTPVEIPVGTFSLEIPETGTLRFVAASMAFRDILGCRSAQLSDLPAAFLARLHPDDHITLQLFLRSAVAARAAISWEGRVGFSKPLKTISIELYPPEVGAAHRVFLGVMQDLTEVRALQERFLSVLEAARAFTWRRDILAGTSQFGERWSKLVRHDKGKTVIPNDGWAALVHPDDAAATLAAVDALERGDVEYQTLLYRRKIEDGSWLWMRVHAGISERDEHGTPVALSGISFDVTAEQEERTRTQEANLRLNKDLDQARAELERTAFNLTEHIPVGTYTMVLKPGEEMAKFDFMSTKFLEITGLTVEDARSNPLKAFACVHPDDFETWVEKNAHCFAHKIPFREEARLLVNGVTSWVVAESNPRCLEDGTWIWEGVIQDITRQKEAEHSLRVANEKLLQSETMNARLSERQELLQDIHDGFGNQLAIGKLRLRRGAATVSDALRIIDDCLGDLKLLFASLEAESGSLWSVLLQLKESVEKRTRHFSIDLIWDIDPAQEIALNSQSLLQIARICQEALANSLRHADARTISVTVNAESNMKWIMIMDDGCGFDCDNVPPGRGLINMRSRALRQGWDLRISSDAAGTRITLYIH
jgi:signal transduction histidine kinase